MNKFVLLAVLSAIIVCTSCDKEEPKENFVGIEGISFENYPKVDGSTSARAVNIMIACKLLNVRYDWRGPLLGLGEWYLEPNLNDVPEKHKDFFRLGERIKTSQTHGAFMNLIDGNADIILTHRTISPDEKAYADKHDVTLIETSIALDAFVFIVHNNNPVKSLTVNEIQKIYTEEITNWSEVGGNNENIQVFTRPRNSGSEEVFRTLVMNGIEPSDFPASSEVMQMSPVFTEILANPNAICYTFNNYKDMIVRVSDSSVPKIAINNIFPDASAVVSKTYPFISELRVAIRSDLDRNSMAYKLYEWLQSESAKSTTTECGFITK